MNNKPEMFKLIKEDLKNIKQPVIKQLMYKDRKGCSRCGKGKGRLIFICNNCEETILGLTNLTK